MEQAPINVVHLIPQGGARHRQILFSHKVCSQMVVHRYSAAHKITAHLTRLPRLGSSHYDDVIMGVMASQMTGLTIVYSTVYSDADQRKHQSSASLAFVLGIHRGPVNSPHKWPVTRKMSPFDDVIMCLAPKGALLPSFNLGISLNVVPDGLTNNKPTLV